eukprot:g31998.t1
MQNKSYHDNPQPTSTGSEITSLGTIAILRLLSSSEYAAGSCDRGCLCSGINVADCVILYGSSMMRTIATCIKAASRDQRADCLELLCGHKASMFIEQLHSVRDKRRHLPVANNFTSPSHSLDDTSILLQCHNDATRKLEEQHLIFRLGSLQPNGLNVDFTSFK